MNKGAVLGGVQCFFGLILMCAAIYIGSPSPDSKPLPPGLSFSVGIIGFLLFGKGIFDYYSSDDSEGDNVGELQDLDEILEQLKIPDSPPRKADKNFCPTPPANISTQEPETAIVDDGIIKKMSASAKSFIFAAPPGTGKTSTIRAFIVELLDSNSDVEIHIVDRKNGAGHKSKRWMGLEKVPGLVACPGDDYSLLMDRVEKVTRILNERRKLPADVLNTLHPVWLILDDYVAMYSILKIRDKKAAEDLLVQVTQIMTDGRELKVCLAILTHSPNAGDFGISAPLKDCAATFVLGRIGKEAENQMDGGFGAVWNALSKNVVIPDQEQRDLLKQDLPKMIEASQENNVPLFLSTMGIPKLGMMPDLSWTKTYEIPPQSRPNSAYYSNANLEDNLIDFPAV